MPNKLTLKNKKTLSFEQYDDGPLGDRQVLLKAKYSGISHGTEMMLYKGTAPKFNFTWNKKHRYFKDEVSEITDNIPLGYESVCQVIAKGADTHGLEIGDFVWLDAPHQETHVLDFNKPLPYFKIPPDQDLKKFTVFALSRVALGAIHDINPIIGDKIAVIGLGVIGLIAVQLLRKCGVREIIALDSDEERLKIAASYGARIFNILAPETISLIKEDIGSIDGVIESSGNYKGLAIGLQIVSTMGKVVVVSSYGNQSEGIFLGHEFHRNRVSIVSSMTINGATHPRFPLWNLDRLNNEAAYLLTSGAISTKEFITEIIKFNQAISAYEIIDKAVHPPLKIVFSYE